MKERVFTLIALSIVLIFVAFGFAEAQRGRPSNQLRSNQVRTRHVVDASITGPKLALTAVAVNVNAAAATGSSAAAPTLVGGTIVAIFPIGNQDQLIDNVVLNGDGSITVTLAAAATAQNNFRVMVLRANGFGTT